MAWNLPRNPASLPSVIGSYSAKPNYTSPPGESPPSLSLRRGSVSSRRDSVSSSATDDAKSTMSRRERAQTRRDSLVSVASSTGSVAFFDDDTPVSTKEDNGTSENCVLQVSSLLTFSFTA